MDGASVLLLAVPVALGLLAFVLKHAAPEFWRLRTELFSWLLVSAGLSFIVRSVDSLLLDIVGLAGQAAVAAMSIRAFRSFDAS